MLKIISTHIKKGKEKELFCKYITIFNGYLIEDDPSYRKRFTQNGKVNIVIICKHKDIWDLNPRMSLYKKENNNIGRSYGYTFFTQEEKKYVLNYLNKIRFFKIENVNNIIVKKSYNIINKRYEKAERCGEIKINFNLENFKLKNIILATEYSDYCCENNFNSKLKYINLYELKENKLVKYHILYEEYICDYRSSDFLNISLKEEDEEKYEEIKTGYKNKTNIKRAKKIFNNLDLKFPTKEEKIL